jgi:hypothetical protein
MNVYPSAIRDVLLSRFSGAVTPYMRTLKQREDQVRFDSPIAFEIERRPELGASQLAVVRAAIETEVRSRLQIRGRRRFCASPRTRARPRASRGSSGGQMRLVEIFDDRQRLEQDRSFAVDKREAPSSG